MDGKISVIVPAYNAGETLSACLESLCAQTHRALEILVVDDGSVDDTARIAEDCAARESRVRLIRQSHGGVAAARLRGVQEASGAWLGFMDADDSAEPEMLARLLENAAEYNAGISHCGYRMVFPDRVDFYYNTGRVAVQDGGAALRELVLGAYEPSVCGKLYRRELFSALPRCGGLDTSIRVNEDLLMNFYLFRAARRTVYEDICPYHYIRRKKGVSEDAEVRALSDMIRVREIILQETAQSPALRGAALQALAEALIRGATLSPKEARGSALRRSALSRLRELLSAIERERDCGGRTKGKALWAACWPAAYRLAHFLYGEWSGGNHRYDVQ